jgi:outer membrane translocation and assembly module TamA
VSGRFDLYHQQSTRRLLFASATLDFARDLDLDNRLSIGGDNGLRGYPLRYQAGSRRALFTVEERYFTRWYPWRLFQVGGAAFIDVGRAWGDDPLAQQDLGWLGDIGIGARFGSSRSGTGTMVHVDLAMPLDGAADSGDVQLVIETKHGF